MLSTTATMPIPTAANRAALISSRSLAFPLRTAWAYRSWAKEADEVRVSPATTARIVAKAMAEVTASSVAPRVDPGPPPSASAEWHLGLALLCPACKTTPSGGTNAWTQNIRLVRGHREAFHASLTDSAIVFGGRAWP